MEGKDKVGGWQADKTPSKIIRGDGWLIFTFNTYTGGLFFSIYIF